MHCYHKKHQLILIALISIFFTAFSPSPKKAPLIDHIMTKDGNSYAYIQKNAHKLPIGSLYTAYRNYHQGRRPVATSPGIVKITASSKDYAIGLIIPQKKSLHHTMHSHYPLVMAGDYLKVKPLIIQNKQQLIKHFNLLYQELFTHPQATLNAFTISRQGQKTLHKIAQKLAHLRVPKLLITAYTDSKGSKEHNQIESYQRALAIKQFFIDDLGFYPQKIIALGLGEKQPQDHSQLTGANNNNRRIVIKPLIN